MNQKALKKAKTNLKLKVKDIARHTTGFNISRYNLTVIGMQNYYCIAKRIMRFRPMELRKKLILYQMLSLHQVKKSILT